MGGIFESCGYEVSFPQEKEIKADKEFYLNKILKFIDNGIPVISNLKIAGHNCWLVFVGYEKYGQTLLYMTDNMSRPEPVASAEVFEEAPAVTDGCRGLIFTEKKKEQKDLGQIYRKALEGLPKLMMTRTPHYCFGAAAFRAWADEIESGSYDRIRPEEFGKESWFIYTNYVCVLATNGSCCHDFLDRALKSNPDLTFIQDLHIIYRRMADMWNKDPDCLEALGGGFNITLETLQDKAKRNAITAKLRLFADCADEALQLLQAHL